MQTSDIFNSYCFKVDFLSFDYFDNLYTDLHSLNHCFSCCSCCYCCFNVNFHIWSSVYVGMIWWILALVSSKLLRVLGRIASCGASCSAHSCICIGSVARRLSVGHTPAPCLNPSTDVDAVRQIHLWGRIAHCVRWGSRS